MSKRPHTEDNFNYIIQKLKKLEDEIKSVREQNIIVPDVCLSEASTNSSSSSTCSSPIPNDQIDWEPPLEVLPATEDLTQAQDTDVPANAPSRSTAADAAVPGPSTEVPIVPTSFEIFTEPDNNPELLELLGEDPSNAVEYGPDLNKEVASRFTYIATTGLDKEARKELMKRFLVPANCSTIAAPKLNAEIKAAVTDQVIKRDKAIEYRQKQLAETITALGRIISDQLSEKQRNNTLLKSLMDTGRLLCDVQHSESLTRRNFALFTIKKEIKDQLSQTKVDKYLFGENLSETLKTAKAVSKSSIDIKDQPKKPNPKSNSSKNLNWKARSSGRRQPTGQAPRPQPPATNTTSGPPRGNMSQVYMQRSKPIHRQ